MENSTIKSELAKYFSFVIQEEKQGSLIEHQVGYIDPIIAAFLKYEMPWSFGLEEARLILRPHVKTEKDRTEKLSMALKACVKSGYCSEPRGETYPVTTDFLGEPLALLDRSAAELFGIMGYAVHMNGLITMNGREHMVVAKRSNNPNVVAPGMYDNMVAGGLPYHQTLMGQLITEANEEAGLPEDLTYKAKPKSVISYCIPLQKNGLLYLRRYTCFCYDLRLPEGFDLQTLQNKDGKIAGFEAIQLYKIPKRLKRFKPEAVPVIQDLLWRHKLMGKLPLSLEDRALLKDLYGSVPVRLGDYFCNDGGGRRLPSQKGLKLSGPTASPA